MKKFVRFAGVALLALTMSVASCGDDDDPVAPVVPVAPTPPPTPPLSAEMTPTSHTIGVGGTVVFAISVSGGAAGAEPTWICTSSDPSKATASKIPAGCQVTAVAVGGVSIIAVVTKGGETVNKAAGLTITEDMVEQARVFVSLIEASEENDDVLGGRVTVTLNVEFGDQAPMQLSVLVDVDGVDEMVAATMPFPGGASAVAAVAAPEGEEGEREQQQAVHPFHLSFNSDEYAVTGKPTYMNGEHTISAVLMVAGSDEPVESGIHDVEFGNGDGVHIDAAVPSNDALDDDGNIWYGGPGTTLKITAVPVLYSGGSASAVTLLGFCGANAETVDATPFEFTPDCEGKGKTTERDENGVGDTPTFTLTVGGEAIAVEEDDIKNSDDDIFPINLDYEGPGAPTFKPNPNDREDGWVNTAVAFMSTSSKDKNAWLTKGASDAGVGGYTPQLQFAAVPSGMDGLKEALVATAYQAVPPVVVSDSKPNAYCVVASAVDKLGNESARPDEDDGTCEMAGVASRDAIVDDPDTEVVEAGPPVFASGYSALLEAAAAEDADEEAIEKLANAGLRAGVDVTLPEAIFAGTSLPKDAKGLGEADATRYILHVTDNRGLRMAEPVVDSLEIRDADGNVDGATTETMISVAGLPLVDVGYDEDGVGYYTYTAQAQDLAGNLSEPAISRVALHDVTVPISALIFARGKDASNYDKTLVMADNLSIRDYTVTISGPTGANGLPAPVRLKRAMVAAYDGDLKQTETASGLVELPFIAVSTANGEVEQSDVITTFTAYVTDQAGNSAADPETVTITVDGTDGGDEDIDSNEGVADGTYAIAVEDDDGAIGTDNNTSVTKSDETITLRVTGNLLLDTTVNPFAKVFFFVEVGAINTGLASDENNPRTELRAIGVVDGINAELKTGTDREWTYETEISADNYYAIVGGAADSNKIHALGVNGDGVATSLTLLSELVIAKR